MKAMLVIIAGISVIVFLIGTIVYPYINETTFDDDYPHDIKTALDDTSSIPDPVCFVIDSATSGQTGSAVTMGSCYPLSVFEDMECTKPMLEHIYRYSNLLDDEFDGTYYLEWIGLPEGISPEKFDECFDNVSQFRLSLHLKKLLIQNQIEYSDKLVMTGGPAYAGDPGCGAVLDVDSTIHWFEIDSISDPQEMTVFSENPMPCKINHASCFCNAQTAFTEIMLTELSYLTPNEEKEIGDRVKTYLETIPHQIPVTKFVVGKYNLDLGEQYNEICGILLTKGEGEGRFNKDYSVYKYFSAAKEGYNVWDFSLSVGNEKLCAISTDAMIFEYEKSDE
jgi:hypothetical protein